MVSVNEEKRKRKNGRKWKMWLILGIVICVIGAGITTLVIIQQKNKSSADTGVTYETYTVESGSLARTVEESGSVTSGNATSVLSDYALTPDEIYVSLGDYVTKGTKIAHLDTDALADLIAESESSLATVDEQLASSSSAVGDTYLSSDVEGRVKEVHIAAGDNVENSMTEFGCLFVISTDGCMKVDFSQNDATAVEVGSSVNIILSGDNEDVTVSGVISSKNDDGTYTAQIDDDTYTSGVAATVQNSDGVTIGTGTLAVSSPYPIVLNKGTVSSVAVDENDYVYDGSTLLYLDKGEQSEGFTSLLASRKAAWEDLQGLRELAANPYITADSDGVLTSLSLVAGGKTDRGTAMYEIAPEKGFTMTISVDEDDISAIQIGQKAAITIDALDDTEVAGEVRSISHIGSSSNGVTTYSVVIGLDDTEGLMSGMNASCTVTIESVEDAVLIPIGAIQTVQNKKYVTIDDGTATGTQKEIELGLVTDTYAQATSGITAGEKILVATYSSTQDNTQTMGMGQGQMGMPGGQMSGGFPAQGGQSGSQGGSQGGGQAGGQIPGGQS